MLLLCLAGCGGSGEDLDPAAGFPSFTTSPTPSTSPTSPTSPTSLGPTGPTAGPTGSSDEPVTPEETTGAPVPVESDHVTDDDNGGNDDGGGQGEDVRVIEIGGPTLDNTFPNDPFNLEDVGAPTCTQFTNDDSDVAVTVRSVRLVNHQPRQSPGARPRRQPGLELLLHAAESGLPGQRLEDLQELHQRQAGAERANGMPGRDSRNRKDGHEVHRHPRPQTERRLHPVEGPAVRSPVRACEADCKRPCPGRLELHPPGLCMPDPTRRRRSTKELPARGLHRHPAQQRAGTNRERGSGEHSKGTGLSRRPHRHG